MLLPSSLAPLLVSLVLLVMATKTVAEAAHKRSVFCHYLPWYTLNTTTTDQQARHGWCGVGAAIPTAHCANTSQKQYTGLGPLIGEYSQRETNVLEYHLLLAQAANIDAFIVNINPSNPLQVELTKALFVATSTLQQKYSTTFDVKLILSYDNSAAVTTALVQNDFNVLSDILSLDRSFPTSVLFRTPTTGGRVFQHWSENVPSQVYATAKQVFGNHSVVVVRNPRLFNDSDSNFEWPLPLNNGTPAELHTYWGEQALKDFEWGMAHNQASNQIPPSMQNLFSVGAVYPGFDDGKVPFEWNGGVHRQIERNVEGAGGAQLSTYNLTWEHAFDYLPNRYGGSTRVTMPWLQIVTWNDFPEGTTIEPTQGESGLEAYILTFCFVKRWHNESSVVGAGSEAARRDNEDAEKAGKAAVHAAVAILDARRKNNAKAEAAVQLFLNGEFVQAMDLLNGTRVQQEQHNNYPHDIA